MKSSRRRGQRRTLAFHLATVVVVLCPLALGELVLRWCVPAPQMRWQDPFVSFSGQRPLFVLNEKGDRFETSAERLDAFRPQSFAAVKSPEAFRIFCLGGSTVQGRPYSVETSFTTWLALDLQAARPDRDWEMVNCGGISYASYRLVPLMQELLGHGPDLFIIYTGHNEFLEDRTYERLKKTPRVLIRLHRALLGLRGYALAERWLRRRRGQDSKKTTLSPEVRTRLDLREGLASYHRDPAWRRSAVEHFDHNMDVMVQMARHAKVPVILVNPVSNLKNCPPFKSQFRTDLTEAEQQQVLARWEQARQLDWAKTHERLELLRQAVAFDDQHAGLLYLLGIYYEHVGRSSEAKQWFVRAKEEDICPLRILESMHEAILKVARRYRIPLVDVRTLIEQRTEDGIPGHEWLLDHVHPSISGHQLIAEALYQAMEAMDLVRRPDHWQAGRDQLWQRHLASLNEAYYAQGAARLERLQEWSRGRIPAPLPHASPSVGD